MNDERTQRVRDRAHALWEQAGRPEGQDAQHWSQAEHEIAAEEEAQSSAAAGKAALSEFGHWTELGTLRQRSRHHWQC